MLNLFYTPDTCALASHIVLEETGVAYETTRIDFASTEQRKPEYLAVNPKGRVPSLVTDHGVLTADMFFRSDNRGSERLGITGYHRAKTDGEYRLLHRIGKCRNSEIKRLKNEMAS